MRLALERNKKVVIATLEIVPDLEKHELYPLIDKLPRIDITEGTGFGANYQVNKQQAKSLVEACHFSLFESGDIEEITESYYPHEDGEYFHKLYLLLLTNLYIYEWTRARVDQNPSGLKL